MANFLPVFENKTKFSHDSKFPNIFRVAIVGKSGSGKTVLMTKLLLNPTSWDYNSLYIYSKMISTQPEIEFICECFNKGLSKENIIALFNKKPHLTERAFEDLVNEVSNQVSNKKPIKATCVSTKNLMLDENSFDENKKNLVIFDDFQNDNSVNELAESLYNNLRKRNGNLVYIGQRYSSIPKMVRGNLNFVIAFLQSKRDADMFYNDILSPFMDKTDFKKLTNKVWGENFKYIAVNLNTGEIYLDIFE